MAETAQVEHLLRHLQMSISQDPDGNFLVAKNDQIFKLTNTAVDQYLTARADIQRPVVPAVFLPGFYEHAVDYQSPMYRAFRDRDEIVLEDRARRRRIVLSSASTMFVLAQLDCDEIPNDLSRFIFPSRLRFFRRNAEETSQVPSFSTIFSRIQTIKVFTPDDDLFAHNFKKIQAIAEAALFHIAYGTSASYSLSLSWERAHYRLGRRRESDVQFPLRTYTSELLAYYHLAIGSDSLILAYLALYKVLEYFFTSSSDKVLHQKMTEKMVEPDFSHTKPQKLKELVKVIRQHDSKLDEKRLLRTVLEHYIDVSDLRAWIQAFDTENEDYLTTEREVFAEPIKIDTSNDQIFSSVAFRIYHIRNAVVHHKEGEVSRFIPFSGQEKILFREIPLLIYLAEQLIIKTGKDIL